MQQAPYNYDKMVGHAFTVFNDKVSADCGRLIREFRADQDLQHEYAQPPRPIDLAASVIRSAVVHARLLMIELDSLVTTGGDDVPTSGAAHLTDTFSGALEYLGWLPRQAVETVVGDHDELSRLLPRVEDLWKPQRVELDYEFGMMIRRHRLRSLATNPAYEEILVSLGGVGTMIERAPTTFTNFQEEQLRDLFLAGLNAKFRGDATGETFNREGRTDIAVRVDGNVVFIAECKFWTGEKALPDTIDQLLGYLTWRDSKAGILLFVRNADFTAVLEQVPDVVAKHPNFVSHLQYSSESSFRFKLKNKTDAAREHTVTLLAFHIPKMN